MANNCYSIHNRLLREILAELLGTFIFGSFAYGATTQNHLSGYFNQLQQNVGVGIGLMFAVYVAGDISGAHVNPAVTLACCLDKRTAWKKLPCYWLTQILGAFAAAVIQFGLSNDMLQNVDGGSKNASSAAIFIVYPSSESGYLPAIFNQVFATFFMACGCLAITEKNNSIAAPTTAPLSIGLLATAIGCSFGLNGGPAVNPALDLGPRILLTLVGWGMDPFSFRNYNWFWVPLFGPLLGGFLGWALYRACISQHRLSDDKKFIGPTINTFNTTDSMATTHL